MAATERRAWLARLPQLRDECAEQWALQLGKPFADASASLALPAKLGHSEQDVRHRLDRLSSELDLDRDRARRWALGQTLAWAEGDSAREHVETARWLAAA